MKEATIFWMVIVILIFGACTQTQTTDTGLEVPAKTDTSLYKIELQILDDIQNSERTGMNVYANEYGTSVTFSSTGKGIVRGYLKAATPMAPELTIDEEIIVKTTDLKLLAVRSGDIVSLTCIRDYEPVCSYEEDNNRRASECEDIWELDNCRLTNIESAPRNGK